MRSARLLAAVFLSAVALPAQQVRKLSRPDAEFPEPFTNLTALRELKDGRVVIVDVRDKVVELVDFKSGSLRKVGREGSGPREYALPMTILPLPGDTSMVFDPLNSRSLLVLPDGEPGDFFKVEAGSTTGPRGGMMIAMTPPRYTDAKGRLYTVGAGVRMSEGGQPVTADSVPILRYDRATKKSDTLAWVRVPKENLQTSGGGGRMQIRMGMANPFTARDDWAVTPDGRVAVLRSPEYRVDWVSPTRVQGAPIAYQKIKVTEAHKQQWRDSRKNATAIMITNNNGRTTTRAGAPGATGVTMPDPADWPEYMPPFLGNDRSVFVAPSGQLWVARTREAGDEVPKYDVIDAAGRVAMRVELPAKTRVVGLGNGTVYTVRTDEDDLQYLQRFRLP